MWQVSVQQEAKELCGKISRLDSFIKSDSSRNLSVDMLSLLTQQLEFMKQYHNVLVQRLKLAEKEEDCADCWTDANSVFC